MLETVNLKKSLSKSAYQKAMPEIQERLRKLQYAASAAHLTTIVCLEGWDAAGKGKAVHKLTEKLDPRLFRVHQGTAPSPMEQRYHFLHRYQLNLPNYGDIAVFDHGWYRPVLEGRCDKLVKKKDWQTAYQQINEFERWLCDDGQIVIKFWMHISKKEQRRRFKKYSQNRNMQWRITKEYRRHHRDYDEWIPAVEDMLAKTETPYAPWTVIEANDQRWALVRIFEVIAQRMEQELEKRDRQNALSKQAAEMEQALHKTSAKTPRKVSRRELNSHSSGEPQAEVAHA